MGEILEMLPWWGYVIIALLVLLIVAFIRESARVCGDCGRSSNFVGEHPTQKGALICADCDNHRRMLALIEARQNTD